MGAATSVSSPAQSPTIDFVSILVLLPDCRSDACCLSCFDDIQDCPSSAAADLSANIDYCERDCRAWMISCLQRGDSCGKCCLTHLHRRPLPGCSLLQNCAKSGPQAARNGRTRGACAPAGGPPGCISGGGPPGCCISDGGAPGGCASGVCAYAPELASVRMTATAKAVLTMSHIPCGRRRHTRASGPREPIKEHSPRRISQAATCRAERPAMRTLPLVKASACSDVLRAAAWADAISGLNPQSSRIVALRGAAD